MFRITARQLSLQKKQEETMAEPLHTWLKEAFSSNCYLGVLEKTVKVMNQREASRNFL